MLFFIQCLKIVNRSICFEIKMFIMIGGWSPFTEFGTTTLDQFVLMKNPCLVNADPELCLMNAELLC